MTYQLLTVIAGAMLAGMVAGAFLFNRLLKKDRDNLQVENMKLKTEIKMADLSLASSRNANEACYDLGVKDGKAAQIKELGKAMLNESTVLRDGSIAKLQDGKIGPKKGAA